ncbi:MAG: glycosyltransferase [Rhodobacteraceae bacterium]|nr:glycosyltransferase [Paracoccaceae bacterium]
MAYLLRGDSAAGDRLEQALLGGATSEPIAAHAIFAPQPVPKLAEPVDIILPVFNAHDDLRDCLDALLRYTAAAHRLHLVDDTSTDPRILPLLRDVQAARPNTRLTINEENLGFVGTVNRALSDCTGHVVLLNSDAMVPDRWLDRLIAPILTDAGVASVTPMSDNAEIFTVPGAREDQARRIDRIAARLNWTCAQAKAPTGVGFCMAMSRTWLDRVPGLDPAFGRGYGEEVDWCRKTAALGAAHLGLGSLFVAHRGGRSFGDDRHRLRQDGAHRLSRRYPDFDASVSLFRKEDPLIGPRLALAIGALGDGEVPIYLAHRLGGGAELWLQDRLHEARCGALVLRPTANGALLTLEVHGGDAPLIGQVPVEDLPGYLGIPETKHVIYSCLVGPLSPFDLLQKVQACLYPEDRLTVLFHDHFPLCPSHTLVGAGGRFCGLPDAETCAACFRNLPIAAKGGVSSILDWRESWRDILGRTGDIIVFSGSSLEYLRRILPEVAAKARIEPHFVPWAPAPLDPCHGAALGVLGNIGRDKGGEVIHRLARANNGLGLSVIGKLDPAFAHPRIRAHGPYDRAEIAALARRYRIGAWFIPSIWPETFCFTVHEALATGLPVYAFDIGAQGEAVRQAPNGHSLDPALIGGEPRDLAAALRQK